MAALGDVEAAQGRAVRKAAVKARPRMVVQYRNHIRSEQAIEACDTNPFGVAVSIRSTLTPAFAQLNEALADLASV